MTTPIDLIDRAFRSALDQMATAQTLDDSEIGLSNAFHHLYRLAEYAKGATGKPAFHARLEAGDDVTDLKKASALLYARNHDTYSHTIVNAGAGVYSDTYTPLYQVLAWIASRRKDREQGEEVRRTARGSA